MSLLVAAELAGAATVGQLADVLGLERTTVTRDLRPLRDRRLVDIGVGEDRRARAIALTDAGREALADALPRWRSAQEKVIGDERVPSWPELADTLMSLDAAARE
jgi:DNA-binding MarR family transcriptional regulator